MTRLHASLKVGRNRAAVRAQIRAFIRQWQPTVATFTEASQFRGLFEADGYTTIQPEGYGELAAMVRDDATWEILPLSSKGIPRRGMQKPYALVLHGDDCTTIVVHIPSGVEGLRGLKNNAQADVWRDCIETLAEYVTKVRGPVRNVGDWNVSARRRWVRRYLKRQFPGFRIVRSSRGTHKGNRPIDFMLTRGIPAESAHVLANPVSDHKAVLFRPKEAPVSNLPSNLPKILRAAGLKVVAVPGWTTRGRPSGGFAPVGVLCHHTATSKATSDANVLRLLRIGRSDLPGPLCQLGLGRDGTVYIVAAGRANHAGKAKASGTVAAGDGNALYIGIEAFNDGVGEPWPKVQYDAYVTLCATLSSKVTGNSANTVRGHKETSVTGKIDPTFDMAPFRLKVAAAMKPKPPAKKPGTWAKLLEQANAKGWKERAALIRKAARTRR